MNPGLARLLRDLDGLRRDVEQLCRDLDRLRRDVIAESRMGDDLDEITERRVAAIEEILFARWPRSIAVKRRLRRDLRASVREYGWAADDFQARRFEAVGDGWLGEPLSPTGRHRSRGGAL